MRIQPDAPERAMDAAGPPSDDDQHLQLVLRSQRHAAYYSPTSHSLSLRPRPVRPRPRPTPSLSPPPSPSPQGARSAPRRPPPPPPSPYGASERGVVVRPAAYPPPAPDARRLSAPAYPDYDVDVDLDADADVDVDVDVGIDDRAGRASLDVCPTCLRPWRPFRSRFTSADHHRPPSAADPPRQTASSAAQMAQIAGFQPPFTAPNYFRLLEASPRVHEASCSARAMPGPGPGPWDEELASTGAGRISSLDEDGHSVPGSPLPSSPRGTRPNIDASSTAPGYYSRFFTQIRKLGRGARGQVYLCQHVLNGNKLGVYAVKKMPCGDDQQVLLDSLKEVLLMETLQHPNIIHYQHAWIENARASSFSPSVPTLFILMAAANGGSLEEYVIK